MGTFARWHGLHSSPRGEGSAGAGPPAPDVRSLLILFILVLGTTVSVKCEHLEVIQTWLAPPLAVGEPGPPQFWE
jgi:hypothetical protein